MRQTAFALIVISLVVPVIAAVLSGPASRAQEVLPTPKGQLGGPMPLETEAPPGQISSPTPQPTPTFAPATPAAGVPQPADCRVAPRPIEDLVAIAPTDVPLAAPSPAAGMPADQATVDGVTASIYELIACLNAGEQLRATALLTDNYLQRLLFETGWSPDQITAILAPLLPRPPERRIGIASIDDVRALSDGRASATVLLVDPGRFALGATTRHRVVLVQDGQRWVVDALSIH